MSPFSAMRSLVLASVFSCGVSLLVGAQARRVNTVQTAPHAAQLQAEKQACQNAQVSKCASLLKQLNTVANELTREQQLQLRFDQSWISGLDGDYRKADALLQSVIAESQDANLRMDAAIRRVNILAEQSRYEDAFRQLAQLIAPLESGANITAGVRRTGFIAVSALYASAGQYELASYYADRIFTEGLAQPGHTCKADQTRIAARYQAGKWQGIESLMTAGIADCIRQENSLYANGIRFFAASLDLRQDHPERAIALLRKHYAQVQRDGYPRQLAQFEATLAEAYQATGQPKLARQFALAAISHSSSTPYDKATSGAYRTLYLLDKQQGQWQSSLRRHEQYMTAHQGYLDALSAKALAYQTVQQQVLAKKTQIAALNKKNEILQLQQSLGKKAMETGRLYTALLLLTLGFVVFLAIRTKRSQLSFKRQAHRDGLTGVANRQHFIAQTERQLRHCAQLAGEACVVLIDLDHFKRLNDTFGHNVGDKVLCQVTRACQANLRATDLLGRLGGEEFGILLTDCSLHQARGRVEQLRAAIEAVIVRDNGAEISVSASFGIAATQRSGHDLKELLIHADDALYEAKDNGRNCIVLFDPAQATHREQMRKSRVSTLEIEQQARSEGLL